MIEGKPVVSVSWVPWLAWMIIQIVVYDRGQASGVGIMGAAGSVDDNTDCSL